MSALYLIKCNGCGVVAPASSAVSLHNARMNNKPGWTHPKAGHDYCPACSEKRKASGAAYY